MVRLATYLSLLDPQSGVRSGLSSVRPGACGAVDCEHDRREFAEPGNGRCLAGATGVAQLPDEALSLGDELVQCDSQQLLGLCR